MFLIVSAPTQADPALAATLRRMRIERGNANPTWTTVRRIAVALGVSLATLAEAVERTKPRR